MSDNSKKIILDLFAGTGAWSQPYLDAGYDVRRITLPEHDVSNLRSAGRNSRHPCSLSLYDSFTLLSSIVEIAAGGFDFVSLCLCSKNAAYNRQNKTRMVLHRKSTRQNAKTSWASIVQIPTVPLRRQIFKINFPLGTIHAADLQVHSRPKP